MTKLREASVNRTAPWWVGIRGTLFGVAEGALGEPLTAPQRQLVAVLEVVRIEEHVVAPRTGSRLPRQLAQTATEALAGMPRACDWGGRKDSPGRVQYWRGYKRHLDVCDTGLPLQAVTTSASLHDSQAAIPMARRTAQRVKAL